MFITLFIGLPHYRNWNLCSWWHRGWNSVCNYWGEKLVIVISCVFKRKLSILGTRNSIWITLTGLLSCLHLRSSIWRHWFQQKKKQLHSYKQNWKMRYHYQYWPYFFALGRGGKGGNFANEAALTISFVKKKLCDSYLNLLVTYT